MRVSAPVLIQRDSALPLVSLPITRRKKCQRSRTNENRNPKAIESCHLRSLLLLNRTIEEEVCYRGNQ